ncbi:MAG TPA: hypothetical protein VFC63_21985 [Blastocatellia bacterium]|nr:hypothetical protein [Blastocatellia bacterium]
MVPKIDFDKIKTWRDAQAVGAPAFKIMSDGIIKAYRDDNGVRRFELTASSDDTDLVGDVMTEKALAKMKSAAPGTTMFLNHQYSVPEDVFGAVETADIETRNLQAAENGNTVPILCLQYKGVVEETNERAVRVHEMMMAGRVKLGASVSVLITDQTSDKDGRRLIDDVYYLECSVVGMPCNRQSWVQNASKALPGSNPGSAGILPADVPDRAVNSEAHLSEESRHDACAPALRVPGELESKIAQLNSEVESLTRQLEEAKKTLAEWEAGSPKILAALRRFAREPLLRTGR